VYYKQVAFIDGRYFSVYDSRVEYAIGETLRCKPKGEHKGGFFVYKDLELAVHAKIKMIAGSNWIFPRTILKVLCWGDFIQYPRFKLCFEYIKPVEDMGFPIKYLSSNTFEQEYNEEIPETKPCVKGNERLNTMKKETTKLELEVLELEQKAKAMGILI